MTSALLTVTVDMVVGTTGADASVVLDMPVDGEEHMPEVQTAPSAHDDGGLPPPEDPTDVAVRVTDVVGTLDSTPTDGGP